MPNTTIFYCHILALEKEGIAVIQLCIRYCFITRPLAKNKIES